jgi:hypothetical protein
MATPSTVRAAGSRCHDAGGATVGIAIAVLRRASVNLIYAPTLTSARSFARGQDLMPGDWKWINDGRVIHAYPRSDIYKLPGCGANPHHDEIDAALDQARSRHRLGSVYDYS